jgi:hypothetical protein
MPLPTENPVVLHAAEDSNMSFGDIRYIKTGIRFYIPDMGIEKTFKSRILGLVVLDSQQNAMDGDLQLIVLCCGMSVRIGRMQPVADMKLFEMKPVPIRFAAYSDEGKRLVFGRGEKVENSTDIPMAKP